LTFPYYYVTNFQENGSTATPFNIYLGMQPNNSTALDQAMVYGSFSLSNVGNNFSENFVGETALNTNYWNPAHSAGPAGIFIVPTNAPYWVDWSLPASGYVLTESASLGPKAIWNNVSTFAPIALSSSEAQLISALDMPGTNEEFFQLVKRTATQLQVLLPGETNAPNTALGYTGSPDPVSLSVIDGMESITVLTVDSKFNPIPGIGDTVSISSSDSAALLPVATAMVNGSVTFGVSNPFFFQSEGSWTVTATDTTNPGIAAGTSASVTVGP
jgi:hypothetical protein